MIPYFPVLQFPTTGRFAIHAFGVLVALGILLGARLTRTRGRELGLQDEPIAQMVTWTLVGGFLFAHFFDVVAYQMASEKLSLLEILNPFGGFSSYGGFMGALMGLFAWARKNKQPVMPYADSLGFGLAFGWLLGRLGCFSAHDHPGRLTDFFLAVQYPGGARHDLGLDEALWAGGVSLLFLILHRKKQPLGLYVTLLTILYAPVRFAFDFLRANDMRGSDPRYFGLTPGQYGSIAVLFAGIGLAIWTRRHAAAAKAA